MRTIINSSIEYSTTKTALKIGENYHHLEDGQLDVYALDIHSIDQLEDGTYINYVPRGTILDQLVTEYTATSVPRGTISVSIEYDYCDLTGLYAYWLSIYKPSGDKTFNEYSSKTKVKAALAAVKKLSNKYAIIITDHTELALDWECK